MISKQIDFENIEWKITPYEGVYVSCLDREENPNNSKISKSTTHAVKVEANHEIGLHYHEREKDWTEFIIFPQGGNIEISNKGNPRSFSGPKPVYLRVNSGETYGIRNMDNEMPLFLISIMKPGFTDYKEIKDGL